MIKTIYFVRHGHYRIPPQNPNDLSYKRVLTLVGLEDIITLARKIEKEPNEIHTIYTSPFKRTKESSALLARVLKKTVIENDLLQERLKEDNSVEHYQYIFSEYDKAIREILKNDGEANIIVSHKLPISLYLSIKSGVTYEEVTADYAHIDKIKMGHCIKATFKGSDLLSQEDF